MPKSVLPTISWSERNHILTWSLITEMEKPENYRVLFGKVNKNENTSGESKIAVYKRIGSVILPDLYALDATAVGERVKGKINSLHKAYGQHAKRLRKTGEGVNSPESQATEDSQASADQYLDFYILGTGPDASTPAFAKNIWDEIEKAFPFFPRLHQILASRPNATPPAVTTGVGPAGRQTLYLQPPSTGGTMPSQPLPSPSAPSFLTTAPAPVAGESETATTVTSSDAGATASATSTGGAAVPAVATPPLTAANASRKQGPQTSSLSKAALAKARKNFQKVPQKRSFEDEILGLQKENIRAVQLRAAEDRAIKQQELLLKGLELNAWSPRTYRIKNEKIEKDLERLRKRSRLDYSQSSFSGSSSSTDMSSSPVRERASSPL